MRKVLLSITAVLLSTQIIAGTDTITSTVINGVQSHSSSHSISTTYPLVYGGQDISRSVIATADESLLAGQGNLVG